MQVFNSHKKTNGKIGDYCDGEQYQEHSLFQDDPCAIQIRLYYDDLEVCNALGSKTKKHKLGKNNSILPSIRIVIQFLLCRSFLLYTWKS